LRPAYRRPTIVYAELGIDVLGVSPHGVQGHNELASDVRTVQVASEQPKHVQLAFTQALDHGPLDGRRFLDLVNGRQQPTDVARRDPMSRDRSEQRGHWSALVHEDPDVALGFGQRQRALQRCDRSWAVTSRL
jgi:hypothetical protein